jgi:hypothetical protein
MDLDLWKPLSTGTDTAVLNWDLDLEVSFDCPSLFYRQPKRSVGLNPF